jgi:TolA-binding protein
MADAHLEDATWERLALNELTAAERDAAFDHVLSCAECSGIWKAVTTLEEGASREGLIAPAKTAPDVTASRTWPYAIAASVALAATGYFLLRQPAPTAAPTIAPPAAIVAQSTPPAWLDAFPLTAADIHVRPEEALATRGSTPVAGEAPLEQLGAALDPYRSGEYGEAARRLESLWREYPGTDRAALYLGVSLLFLDRAGDAIAPLRAASAAPQQPVAADAQWYLAVALARSNQPDAAVAQLKPLCDAGGADSPRACAALQALATRRQP